MNYEKEFRQACPETIGETYKDFDISNYTDFLEAELETVKKERDELKELVVWIEDNVYRHSKVMQKCREILEDGKG